MALHSNEVVYIIHQPKPVLVPYTLYYWRNMKTLFFFYKKAKTFLQDKRMIKRTRSGESAVLPLTTQQQESRYVFVNIFASQKA